MTIATKAGLTRFGPITKGGPGQWPPVGRPEYLRQQCEMSLRPLRLEVIDLWQLHRIDPKVAREEQFGVLKEPRDQGKVRHVGLSQVSVEELDAARAVVSIVTVQDRYDLVDRSSAEILVHCERHGVGSSRGRRSPEGDSPSPAARSRARPRRTASPRARWRWRGCCTARR